VFSGDLIHSKNQLTPELIEITSWLLTECSKIAKIIIIPGNHDALINNTERLDSLTPIVNALQHPNLYYIKDSALVDVADVTFAVCSIFDEPAQWPSPTEIDNNRTKIALYHGPVHGAVTDANFVITNRHVQIEMFDGFDAVLLGDIHKPNQIMQTYEVNEVEVDPADVQTYLDMGYVLA
jgi:DNA repair exonuclease SbcCD nuclease subunit